MGGDEEVRVIEGDCLEVLPTLLAEGIEIGALVTDPPYGINYRSGMTGHNGGVALPGIIGDGDSSLRDATLSLLTATPAIVFGTWRVERPLGTVAVLTWEKGDHVGMGDLAIPWKPNTEEIYIIGRGFTGHRGSSVLRHPAPVSWNSTEHGREHPHQKPVPLMVELINKCPPGLILDPFAGSGTTGVACLKTGRRCILIEKDPRYIEVIRRRLRDASTPLFDGLADADSTTTTPMSPAPGGPAAR
jgi:hypothetical protein